MLKEGVGNLSEEKRTWLKSPVKNKGLSLKERRILVREAQVSALLSRWGCP